MTVEERLRDATEQLRIATEALPVPQPRFELARRRRPVGTPMLGTIAVAVVLAVVSFTVWRNPDGARQLTTVSPPATDGASESERRSSLDELPKLTGRRLDSAAAILAPLGVYMEARAVTGVYTDNGRVVSQDPPAGTPLSGLRGLPPKILLRVGPPLAVADDEIDLGLTGDSPQGPLWRVVASEVNGGFCLTVFTQDDSKTSCFYSLTDAKTKLFVNNYNPAIGVYVGVAPAGTTPLQLVDASGQVVATAIMSDTAFARAYGVVIWAAAATQPDLALRPICVAAGAGTSSVPEVIGQSYGDAVDRIRQAGLDVIPIPGSVPTNETVSEQEPPPGALVPAGACVRLGFTTRSTR